MNIFKDVNKLYQAGLKAIKGASFKYNSQSFEMDLLNQILELSKSLINGTYSPKLGYQFTLKERGKVRHITSNNIYDKTVNHLMCDEILTPKLSKYMIYDNAASRPR